MGTCVDCYGTSTIAPCATVGCLSTNYGKCITYSGLDLYCSLGAVGTLTSSGLAVVPGTTTVYTLGGTNVSGSGTGATFEVTRTVGSNLYTVKIANRGSGYAVGNQVKILGTSLGGTTTANDLVITIVTLNAVIPTGATLDSIISTFHSALCSSVAGGGIDYSALNYSCLRQGGALTGIGSVITTESQFVTSASAALCALSTSLNAYDTTINITAFTNVGTLPGVTAPYTLNEVLGGVATAIVNLGAQLNYTSITSNPCIAYAFTTKPVTSVVSDYFNWVTTNMCGMFQSLTTSITTVTTLANSLKTYISGGSAVPANIDTSVLSGGSSTSTASAALILLVSQMNAVNTSISTLTTFNLGLTWTGNFTGTYLTNSLFKTQTWNWSNSPVSLQTQLDRIVSVLNTLNTKFDATQFTIAAAAGGGATIALLNPFTCASLNSCTIDSLGDVNSPSPTTNHFLVRDVSGQWTNKSVSVTINGSAVGVTKTDGAGVGGAVNFDLAITTNTPTIYSLSGTTTVEYNTTNAARFSLGAQPMPYGVKYGSMVTLQGVLQMNIIASFGWTHLGAKIIASLPTAIRPTNPVYFVAEVYIRVSGTYSMNNTRATGQIDSSGNLSIILMNSAGSISLIATDIIEVVIGGISYPI